MSKDNSKNRRNSTDRTMEISTEEFSLLQNQIMELKSEKYDLQQREKHQSNEMKRLKQSLTAARQDLAKSQNIIKQSKVTQNVAEMSQENEQLRKMIEMMNAEHREQNEALRKNMHHVYEGKTQLEGEMQEQKKEIERLEKRIVEMKKREIEATGSDILPSNSPRLPLNNVEGIVTQALKKIDIESLISKEHVEERMAETAANASEKRAQGAGESLAKEDQSAAAAAAAADDDDDDDDDDRETDQVANKERDVNISNDIAVDLSSNPSTPPLPVRTLVEDVIKSLQHTLPELLQHSYLETAQTIHTTASSEDRASSSDAEGENITLRSNGTPPGSPHDGNPLPTTPSTVMSPDIDLLNRVTNLENELEQNRKEFEVQKNNLEQQLEIWKEKNNLKQEKQHAMNEHISELQDNIDDLNEAIQKKKEEVTALESQLDQSKKDHESVLKKLTDMEQSRAVSVKEKENTAKKIHNMQQMINNSNKKLKEVSARRDNLMRELTDTQKKLTQAEPLVEKGKKFDQVTKDLEEERTKNESLREDISKLQAEQERLNGEISRKDSKIKSSQTSVSQLRDQIEMLNAQMDSLSKEKDNIVERTRSYVSEMSERDQTLTNDVKSLRDVVERQTPIIEQLERETIHNFVQLSLAQVSLRIATEEHANSVAELEQLRLDRATSTERQQEIDALNSKLERKIKDQEVDIGLKLKQSKALIRELRSQVQKERKKNAKTLSSSSSTTNLTVPRNVESPTTPMRSSSSVGNLQRRSSGFSDVSMSSFGAMNNTSVINGSAPRHHRTTSSSSRRSIDSTVSDAPSAYYPNVNDEQLIKENNILLHRIADLQTTKWHLEEQSRMLKDEIARSKLELDKKGEIIEYYLQREKLGRLAPEQERHRSNMARKSERSFMGSLFSSGIGNNSPSSSFSFGGGGGSSSSSNSSNKNLSTEAYGKMQQVMEETLLLNIELQQNMKTMGEDIAKLQAENEQLKSRLFAVKS